MSAEPVYFTVVYRMTGDKAAHAAWWETIRPLFLNEEQDLTVTAICKSDELTRLDNIREILNDQKSGDDKLDAIETEMERY